MQDKARNSQSPTLNVSDLEAHWVPEVQASGQPPAVYSWFSLSSTTWTLCKVLDFPNLGFLNLDPQTLLTLGSDSSCPGQKLQKALPGTHFSAFCDFMFNNFCLEMSFLF